MKNMVTVSPKFQVVIPKEVREHLKMKPKQKLFVMEGMDGIIHLVPLVPWEQLQEKFKGLEYSDYRDEVDDPQRVPGGWGAASKE